ncbi:hypothetical protein [Rossellomorea sp. NPDC077527]|uniref:hypothetical protein n=1 Tax=Rossellomorea sp. NPDC077527 TaxID=3364510 RepID=UPI0037C82247
MKRLFITFALLMILISSGILVFQWMGFRTESAVDTGTVEVNQSYSIVHQDGEFKVNQTIHFPTSVPDSMTIYWPDGAENFTCKNQDGKNCLTKENGEFQISTLNVEPQEITVTYTIHPSTEAGFILLRDWFPVFSGVSTSSTVIQLTEKSLRTGNWLAGYQSASHKKLDYIDYYFFSGEGQPSDLLWTKNAWKEKRSPAVRMLTEEGVPSDFGDSLDSLDSDEGFVTIIQTKKIKPFQSPHLIVMGGAFGGDQINNIRRSLLYQTMSSRDDDAWLKEVVVGLLLNDAPPTGKSAWAYKQLKDGLSPSEWDELRQIVKNPTVDHIMLDDAVSKVTGFTSSFFADSVKGKGNENQTLILHGNKPIIINQESKELSYLLFQRKKYIQFAETVKDLGFEMREIEPGVFLTTVNGNSLRFYVNEDYFIYNEENYGVLVKPVQTIGDSDYIDIQWLEKLFKVDVVENDQDIKLVKEK